MNKLKQKVLVLNQNYEPLSITIMKRAAVLMFTGKAELVERRGFDLHSVNGVYPAPSVIRLKTYIHVNNRWPPLTRKNILKRDNHTCQYCGVKGGDLTIDHVIPKDRGGRDTWDNLVTACVKCNNRKGNRTPEEAGMKLRRKPFKPYYFMLNLPDIPDPKWEKYLFLKHRV